MVDSGCTAILNPLDERSIKGTAGARSNELLGPGYD